MKALSIRQPWAWLIVRPDLEGPARESAIRAGLIKDYENREWKTSFRGRFLVHASNWMTHDEYDDCRAFTADLGIRIPKFEDLPRGGIVGEAEIVACRHDFGDSEHLSWWFLGTYGFRLANQKPLPFVPLRGALGFFDAEIPDAG